MTTQQFDINERIENGPTTVAVPELTTDEKIDAIYRFVAQFGDLMVTVQPVLAKLSEHPMIQAFLG